MKRIVLVGVGILMALVVTAPMVAAQPNGEPPQDIDELLEENPVDLPAGAVFGNCAFPIRLEYSGKAKTIDLPGDRFVFTSPGLTATLTNLDSGKQARLNVTGAFHQSTRENGDVVTVVTGRNLLGDPEAGFVLAKGRFSYVFDDAVPPDGPNLVQPLSGKGTLTDVCGLLG